MADEVASLLVRITADGSQAVGVLNGVASTVTTLADKNASLMNKVAATGNLAGSVGRTITKTFGVATVAGLTASAKAAGQLNKELANIGTLSVPTERLKEFKGDIQDIAIATAKSTSDISEGTYQVISAFGDAPDTMEKVEINAKAATAGLATTADSIALTSAVTKAYGDTSAGAVQKVADLAFKTVELGQTTFPELARSMQQVTSLSKELGVSQEELFGAYATLTGVTGGAAEVQTQLKAVYTALLKPSENMEKAIQKQGYASGYSMIKTLGFAGTINALKSATNGSEEQMLGLFNNVRAMPAIMALTGAQADTFAIKLDKMAEASGAAAKAFEVQTEGVAKTGFTLEQAKVKMQVAAQNFGESAAPIIADFADIVDNVSTKLSNMSDEERKAIINTGLLVTKVGAGLAVGGKALTMGAKIAGTAKTVGTALAGAGVLTNPVILGVAGITTAVVAGKSAYDAWYNSQYRWTNGLSDGNAKIRESINDFKNLSKIQQDIKAAKLIIENPESSKEQVSEAKAKIEEIKTLLEKEYDLKIKSDNSNLESTVEMLKNISENETRQNILNQTEKLEALKPKFDEYQSQKSGLEADLQSAIEAQERYSELKLKISELDKTSQDYAQSVRDLGVEYGVLAEWQRKSADPENVSIRATAGYNKAADAVERYSNKLKSLKGSYDEYIAISTEIANWQTELIGSSALEGNAEKVQSYLSKLGEGVRRAGLDLDEYAKKTSLAMNGVDKLETAWEQAGQGDGTALNNIANDYVRAMQEFGASAQETATGAALICQGFHSIAEAAEKGELDNVTAQANELAHTIGDIPEDKRINISANGDISVIDTATGKVQELQRADGTIIRVDADGNVEMLDRAGQQIALLQDIGAVEIKVNAETGDIEALDKAGNVVANLSKQSENNVNLTVTANADPAKATITDLNKEKVEVSIGGNPSPAQQVINGLNGQTITLNIAAKGAVPKAKGTQNFSGGLALVNDDGRADPRELIIDRGRAFIPEGRDVMLPLSRGAKVYTSEQTKAIMSGLGIPRYASGKNNSDAFTSAKDDWTHYTKTHAVTTSQELQKWLEFQEKYKENEKDIWDIEEQVFSLQKKLYSERVSESEKWLRHEEKYNGMCVSDYLAGIDRMKAYTAEYYAQGIISHKEYTEAMADLDEKYIDKRKEQLSELYDLSTAYISEHTYFNDWDDNGDDPLSAYNRVMERNREALANGELTQKEYDEYAKNLGSDMLSQRIEQSKNWLEEQRKYFGMSDAEYVAGLERIKKYTQEYYDLGLTGRREYNEAMTDLNHSMWDEALDAYDDMLQKQQDYISEMREQFQKEEQALQDSWTVADRKTDMSEVQAQLDIYKNAVTDAGRKKYAELEKEMQQLQRDDELYQLQVKNTATIDALQADYKTLEENKKNILDDLRATDIDISAYVDSISTSISNSGANIESLLSTLINKFDNLKIENTTNYNDMKNIVNNISHPSSEKLEETLNGYTWR